MTPELIRQAARRVAAKHGDNPDLLRDVEIALQLLAIEAYEELQRFAKDVHGEEVGAVDGDTPFAVGMKLAAAVRARQLRLQRQSEPEQFRKIPGDEHKQRGFV